MYTRSFFSHKEQHTTTGPGSFLFSLSNVCAGVPSCSSAPYHSVLCEDIAELTGSALLHFYIASNILLLQKIAAINIISC